MSENPWIDYGLDINNLDPEHERIISTPHEHESEHCPPVWIMWEVDDLFPTILSLASNERDARFLTASYTQGGGRGVKNFFIERTPMNHPFGSSLTTKLHAIAKRNYGNWTAMHGIRYDADNEKYVRDSKYSEYDFTKQRYNRIGD